MLIHLLLPAAALAWGGMIPAEGTKAETGVCEATFQPDGGDVVLTLGCIYEGDAVDLGWVIPVPVVPETPEILTEDPFADLREASRPTWRVDQRVEGGCCSGGEQDTGPEEAGDPLTGVDIDGQIWVGDTSVDVWSADQVAEMKLWFDEKGWSYVGLYDQTISAYALEDWSFVVVTLDPGEETPEGGRHLPWIRLRYSGDMVWPAAMSRYERADTQLLTIWFLGDKGASLQEPWAETPWEWLVGEPDEDPVAVWERELWKAGGMTAGMARSWSSAWEGGYATRFDGWVSREACDEDATWVLDVTDPEDVETTVVLYEFSQAWLVFGGVGLLGVLLRRRKERT